MHSPNTGVGKRSTTNLTKQKASLRLAQAIAESSLEINTRSASINSSSCSFDFESLLASYSDFLIPIKHQANRFCKSVLDTDKPGMLPSSQVHAWYGRSIFRGPPSKRFPAASQARLCSPPRTSPCRIHFNSK